MDMAKLKKSESRKEIGRNFEKEVNRMLSTLTSLTKKKITNPCIFEIVTTS